MYMSSRIILIFPVVLCVSCGGTRATGIQMPDIPVVNYNSPLGNSIPITSKESFGFNMIGVDYLCKVISNSNLQDVSNARNVIENVYRSPISNDFYNGCRMFYQDNQLLNVGGSRLKTKQQKVMDATNQLMNLAYNIESKKYQQDLIQKQECNTEINKAKDIDLAVIDLILNSGDEIAIRNTINNDGYKLKSIKPECKKTSEYEEALQLFDKKINLLEEKLAGINKLKSASINKPKSDETSKSDMIKPIKSNKIKKKVIGNAEICKAAIGEMFGHSPSIIEQINISNSTVSVGYIRDVDNTQWNFECKFNGDEVIWRALPGSTTNYVGRWRDSYAEGDPKVTYNVNGNKVTITESYNDGYGNSKIYSFH